MPYAVVLCRTVNTVREAPVTDELRRGEKIATARRFATAIVLIWRLHAFREDAYAMISLMGCP